MTALDETRPPEVPLAIARMLRALRRCDAREIAVVADPAGREIAGALAARIGIAVVPAGGENAHPVVLHADPREGTLGSAIRAATHLGTVVTTGPYPGDAAVIADYYREIIVKEMSVIGSGQPSRADMEEALSIVAAWTFNVSPAAAADVPSGDDG